MSEAERNMERGERVQPLDAAVAKAERNRLWREENRASLEAYAAEVVQWGGAAGVLSHVLRFLFGGLWPLLGGLGLGTRPWRRCSYNVLV